MRSNQLSVPIVASILAAVLLLIIGFGYVYLNKNGGGGGDWGIKKSGLPPGMRGKGDRSQTGGVPSMPGGGR